MQKEKSNVLFKRAEKVAPSGVHSDFRQAYPVFFKRAKGSHILDVDDNDYIDYHLAFGPILLGHSNDAVNSAVREQLELGDLWGIGSHELELEVAEKITHYVPSARKVRFCNSGTEASFHALRLARAHTRKRKVIKFEGSYHGWHDYVDIGVFPQKEKLGQAPPNSAGILDAAAEFTLVSPYNDIQSLETLLEENREDVAAVFVEPILHSCGCIMPKPGFLESLRDFTRKHDTVLIFDEVISGFRHSLGGAQKILGVTPDLTIFAKALANGFPIGAVSGREDIMDRVEPRGDVHVAGTFSGHPISMAAAKATINHLESGAVHDRISGLGESMRKEIDKAIQDEGVPAKTSGFKSIFTVYFLDKEIENFSDLRNTVNEALFKIYCDKMHELGIFIPPQSFKRCHFSFAHSEKDFEQTSEAVRLALKECRKQLRA